MRSPCRDQDRTHTEKTGKMIPAPNNVQSALTLTDVRQHRKQWALWAGSGHSLPAPSLPVLQAARSGHIAATCQQTTAGNKGAVTHSAFPPGTEGSSLLSYHVTWAIHKNSWASVLFKASFSRVFTAKYYQECQRMNWPKWLRAS